MKICNKYLERDLFHISWLQSKYFFSKNCNVFRFRIFQCFFFIILFIFQKFMVCRDNVIKNSGNFPRFSLPFQTHNFNDMFTFHAGKLNYKLKAVLTSSIHHRASSHFFRFSVFSFVSYTVHSLYIYIIYILFARL